MAKPTPPSSSAQAICGNCGAYEKVVCKCAPNERRWESLGSILGRCKSVNESSHHSWLFIYLEYRRWFSPIANSVSSDVGILTNFPAFEGWYPVWFLPNPPVELNPEICAEKVLPLTLYFSDGTFTPAWVTHEGTLIVKDYKRSSPQSGVALDENATVPEARAVDTARNFSWKEILSETRGTIFGEYFRKRNGGRKISHIVATQQEGDTNTDTLICREFPMCAETTQSAGGQESVNARGNLASISRNDIRTFAPSLLEEFSGRNKPKFTREEASMCRTYIEAMLNKAEWCDLSARDNIKNLLSVDHSADVKEKESAKELVRSFLYLQSVVGQVYGNKIEEEVIEEG